jgi:ribose transport system substrate-binding protein
MISTSRLVLRATTAIATAATLGVMLTTAVFAADGAAKGDTSGFKIGFSNSYSGSSFRQVMNSSFEEIAKQAKEAGLIADYGLVTANNNATEQAGQIQNMILEGYNAIVILAASDTALNGVVKDACDAGIVVVVFAGTVSEPCAYTANYNWDSMGLQEIEFMAEALGGKGNLLEIRGIAGDSTDQDISDALHKPLEVHPDMKIVGTVYGQWTATVAQKEVATILPSLPDVQGVITQGGDGYGAAAAFEAAGRDLPVIIMGNRQDELAWWAKQRDASGYKTMSLSATPSCSQVAFWIAQQLLAGKEVPKFVEIPLLVIKEDQLDQYLSTTPEGGVANVTYSQDDVVTMIDAM